MRAHRILAASALCAAMLSTVHATDLPIAAGDGWYGFNVDDFIAPVATPLAWIDYADGSVLSFSFTIAAGSVGRLTVVDAVTAGESFAVYANGELLGTTAGSGISDINVGYDYDAALANPAFSRGIYELNPGSYTVTGVMLPAADGINVTHGGLKLDAMAPVPEVPTIAMWLAGLGLLASVSRRRAG